MAADFRIVDMYKGDICQKLLIYISKEKDETEVTECCWKLLLAVEDTLSLFSLINQGLHNDVKGVQRSWPLFIKRSLGGLDILQLWLRLRVDVEQDNLLLGKLGQAGRQGRGAPVHVATGDPL